MVALTARDNKLRGRNASLPMLAPPQGSVESREWFVQKGVCALCAHASPKGCRTHGGALATPVFGRRGYSPCIGGGAFGVGQGVCLFFLTHLHRNGPPQVLAAVHAPVGPPSQQRSQLERRKRRRARRQRRHVAALARQYGHGVVQEGKPAPQWCFYGLKTKVYC